MEKKFDTVSVRELPHISCYENREGQVLSKIDNGYVGLKGVSEKFINHLSEKGIHPQLRKPENNVCSIGKSDIDGKWYGWSHRAIYGFEVGSKVSYGDCAYNAPDKESYGKKYMDFFASDDRGWMVDQAFELDVPCDDPRVGYKKGTYPTDLGVYITATYTDEVPNEKLRGTQYTTWWYYPEEFGRGEWTAETEEDAKQMAMDFADSVS